MSISGQDKNQNAGKSLTDELASLSSLLNALFSIPMEALTGIFSSRSG